MLTHGWAAVSRPGRRGRPDADAFASVAHVRDLSGAAQPSIGRLVGPRDRAAHPVQRKNQVTMPRTFSVDTGEGRPGSTPAGFPPQPPGQPGDGLASSKTPRRAPSGRCRGAGSAWPAPDRPHHRGGRSPNALVPGHLPPPSVRRGPKLRVQLPDWQHRSRRLPSQALVAKKLWKKDRWLSSVLHLGVRFTEGQSGQYGRPRSAMRSWTGCSRATAEAESRRDAITTGQVHRRRRVDDPN